MGHILSEHGVYNNVTTDTAVYDNPPELLIGPMLKAAGYQLGYSGKLHVGRDVKAEDCGFTTLSTLEQDSLEQNEARKSVEWEKARSTWLDIKSRKTGEVQRPEWINLQLYSTLPDSAFEAKDAHERDREPDNDIDR